MLADVDMLAPCALGGVLDEDTVPALRAQHRLRRRQQPARARRARGRARTPRHRLRARLRRQRRRPHARRRGARRAPTARVRARAIGSIEGVIAPDPRRRGRARHHAARRRLRDRGPPARRAGGGAGMIALTTDDRRPSRPPVARRWATCCAVRPPATPAAPRSSTASPRRRTPSSTRPSTAPPTRSPSAASRRATGSRCSATTRYGFVVTYFARARLGLICVPINFMLGAERGRLHPRPLRRDRDGRRGRARCRRRGRHRRRRARAAGDRARRDRRRPSPAGSRSRAGRRTTTPPSRTSTSPTTTRSSSCTRAAPSRGPKGAMLTSRSLIAQYVSCFVDGEMTPDDVEVHALPLYHCAQLHCFLTPDSTSGRPTSCCRRPTRRRCWRRSRPSGRRSCSARRRCGSRCCATRTSTAATSRRCARATTARRSCRSRCCARSVERLPDVRLFNFYGQTEMSPMATLLGPEDQVRKAGSAGRPAINVETQVVDDDDRPLPPGEVGEIVHRSPHAMLGYWDDPEKTAETFRNGWFHSGDLGVIDDEGYLSVVDRKKDMIKSGGENVASREVEEVIYAHPAVAEVAVFGDPAPALDRGRHRRRRAARRRELSRRGGHRASAASASPASRSRVRRPRRRAAQERERQAPQARAAHDPRRPGQGDEPMSTIVIIDHGVVGDREVERSVLEPAGHDVIDTQALGLTRRRPSISPSTRRRRDPRRPDHPARPCPPRAARILPRRRALRRRAQQRRHRLRCRSSGSPSATCPSTATRRSPTTRSHCCSGLSAKAVRVRRCRAAAAVSASPQPQSVARLSQRTLGLVGYGRIGRRVAEKAPRVRPAGRGVRPVRRASGPDGCRAARARRAPPARRHPCRCMSR